MIFKRGIILLALLIHWGVCAQEAGKLLRKELIIDISVGKDDVPIIKVQDKTIKKIEDPSRARAYLSEEITFFDEAFETEHEVEAFTLYPKSNGKMKKVAVTSIQTEDHLSRGIFYSGTKRKIVSFSNVVKGAELHCTFSYEVKDPHMLPAHFFNDYLACDSSIVQINVSSDVDLGYLEFYRGFDKHISFEKKLFENGTTYFWRASKLEPRKYEEDSGGVSCSNPHVIPHIRTYNAGNGDIAVLRSKEDLFAWYSTLVQDFELSSDYQSILDELKEGEPSKDELAARIFNWVQKNVKYIAYEEGIEGFQPRNPNDVIKNRFGDCKDMVVLVATMMKGCGIECYYAWVGTRDKCYTYDECPTPMVDNHMIAAYPIGDSLVFIDPTSSFSEFGVPSTFVQGKEAMVRVDKDQFVIKKIPVMPSEYNSDMDVIKISLNGSGIDGQGINILSGYLKGAFQAGLAYSDLTPEKLFINFHDIGNKSVSIGDLVQLDTEINGGTLKSTYGFTVQNYVETFENSIYLNPFIKSVIDFELSERTMPQQFDEKFRRGAVVTLLLDDGYSVKNSIQDTYIKENGFELDIKVSEDDKSLTVEYTFTSDRLDMQPQEFEALNNTLRKMKKELKQSIELTYED
ncbi:MAG: transglutaminase family protein [Fluviicola sp.]